VGRFENSSTLGKSALNFAAAPRRFEKIIVSWSLSSSARIR
jgi:hypothetical protein